MDIFQGHIFIFMQLYANMTHLFQPMDLMVNNQCNIFMKNKFGEWFAKKVENSLKLGLKVEEINIQFRLTTRKRLHAHWLLEFNNHTTSASGSSIIINGLKDTAIFGVIQMSITNITNTYNEWVLKWVLRIRDGNANYHRLILSKTYSHDQYHHLIYPHQAHKLCQRT